MSKIREVTIHTTVEIGDIEREVTLKFACHPAEAMTRTYPGCPEEAEFLSGFFDDSGDDAEDFIDSTDFECEALEKASEEDGAEADAAAEAKYEQRRDEGF